MAAMEAAKGQAQRQGYKAYSRGSCGGRMPAKKAKEAREKYDWKHDYLLHEPEEWVMLIVALLGIVNLLPNVNFGSYFQFAWPIIIIAVFLYKLSKRKTPE